MSKAHYHQSGKPPVEFFIVAENVDGTVHVSATETGKPSMLSVPVAEAATAGHVTRIGQASPADEKSKSELKGRGGNAAAEKARAEAAAAAAAEKARAEAAAAAAAEKARAEAAAEKARAEAAAAAEKARAEAAAAAAAEKARAEAAAAAKSK